MWARSDDPNNPPTKDLIDPAGAFDSGDSRPKMSGCDMRSNKQHCSAKKWTSLKY